MKSSAIDIGLARAALYRLLSLAFSYPNRDVFSVMSDSLEAGGVASAIVGGAVQRSFNDFAGAVQARGPRDLADEWLRLFTYSASPDCPLNECAYSAKHIYQEVQELADLSGFYRAFGLDIQGQRPDELSAELEFSYLLALKEAFARERNQRSKANLCVDAQKDFLRDHLARWATNVGRRLQVLAPETGYGAFGRLLAAFVESEADYLHIGAVKPHGESPQPVEAPDELACEADIGELAVKIDQGDFLGELTPVTPGVAKGG